MFRPSSRTKKTLTSINSLPLSPKGIAQSTITLTSMNSNQENQPSSNAAAAAAAGKNVHRIRLKKKSEQTITPLQIAASRIPEIMARQKSAQAGALGIGTVNTNFRKEPEDPANDWRISVIEPNSGAPSSGANPSMPFSPTDQPENGLSPDRRVRKFVGTGDLMISAIKTDKVGLPGQDSDDEFPAVIEESGMIDKEELKELQSPFFEGLDDI